ncbi:hypothetical protein EYF80_008771 [Liparis tanakae]|uniref:Uncharacterized protein n=1 Tax=Liparis tanakae TaxID=230148 RepID=A0A4Z2IT83_9TELE|nr:hypothetical protein EYF80_008771 [Liparis tanakae]
MATGKQKMKLLHQTYEDRLHEPRRVSSSTETPFTGSVCSQPLLRAGGLRSPEHVPTTSAQCLRDATAAATRVTAK